MVPSAQPSVLLASASPRRRSLLSLLGWGFTSTSVALDESRHPGESPTEMATRLAVEKAERAAAALTDVDYVLGADTVVALGDEVLGKPATRQEAGEMLRKLRGKSHQVITGVAFVDQRGGRSKTDACTSQVPMREYSDPELEAYLDSGSPMDKAGAYGIQDEGFQPVPLHGLRGCYANVMGLPLCLVVEHWIEWGVEPPFNAAHGCDRIDIQGCMVYPLITERLW